MQGEPYRAQPMKPPRVPRWSARQLGWFSAVPLVLAPCFVVLAERLPGKMSVVALVPISGVTGVVLATMALVRGRRTVLGTGARVLIAFFGIFGNLFMALVGGLAALMASAGGGRGRQIRHAGALVLAPLAPGSAWSGGDAGSLPVDDAHRPALAQAWRANGRTEHASVAAFARLTLDLMALGAPPALVAAAQRDALDEVRHAELCFALARRVDGGDDGPAGFPEVRALPGRASNRNLALATLAVDSLIDGALHEGVSAQILARLAPRCAQPAVGDAVKSLAADEGRHAAHGWDVVRYCMREGGSAVAAALEGALRGLPTRFAMPLPEAAEDGGFERYGIPGRRLITDEFDKARRGIERRLRALLDAAQHNGSAPRLRPLEHAP